MKVAKKNNLLLKNYVGHRAKLTHPSLVRAARTYYCVHPQPAQSVPISVGFQNLLVSITLRKSRCLCRGLIAIILGQVQALEFQVI